MIWNYEFAQAQGSVVFTLWEGYVVFAVFKMWELFGLLFQKCIRHSTNSKGTSYTWGLTWTVNLDYLSNVSRSGWNVTTEGNMLYWVKQFKEIVALVWEKGLIRFEVHLC